METVLVSYRQFLDVLMPQTRLLLNCERPVVGYALFHSVVAKHFVICRCRALDTVRVLAFY
jgi:hypothetical protein